MSIFADLLDPRIATAQMAIGAATLPLLEGEDEDVSKAVAKRRREYSAGRACARDAMATLGLAPVALPASRDRLPAWPPGIVGSITHDNRVAAAAVARRADGVRSVGIDLEPGEPLPGEIYDTVCLPEEMRWLGAQSEPARGLLARALFSAKEAAFKCQFPLTGRMLEFDEVAVRFDIDFGAFEAEFLNDEVARKCGRMLQGRARVTRDYVACAATLTAD